MMTMQLKTQSLTNQTGILITVDSEHLDAGNAPEFKKLIQPLLDANELLVIDMQELKFVDSSGLGALLSCLRSMNNKQSRLMLVGMNKPVRALFELVRMHRIFAIYNTLEEALAQA
jgi:anti-sigma B factor antagonist